jgi:hypothetical protein
MLYTLLVASIVSTCRKVHSVPLLTCEGLAMGPSSTRQVRAKA